MPLAQAKRIIYRIANAKTSTLFYKQIKSLKDAH